MAKGAEGTVSQRSNGGTETNEDPIGVFDSGVGGLSLLAELRRQLPHENVVYFADSAYAPYGARPSHEIVERSLRIARRLTNDGAKAILVACNTATVHAVRDIRQAIAVPVVAIEPAVKPAAEATQTGVVGVLATAATLGSDSFERLTDLVSGVRVISRPCHGLVEEIEHGTLDGPEVRRILSDALKPILEAHADTVVLGCTHYPLVRAVVEQIVGPTVSVIDPAGAVIRQLRRRLEEGGLLNAGSDVGAVTFLTSGDAEALRQVVAPLWNGSVTVRGKENI
jgi:glutamate racemase